NTQQTIQFLIAWMCSDSQKQIVLPPPIYSTLPSPFAAVEIGNYQRQLLTGEPAFFPVISASCQPRWNWSATLPDSNGIRASIATAGSCSPSPHSVGSLTRWIRTS